MAHRLAREAAGVFAAVSSVSMPVLVPDAIPSRPVSVLHFHGTSDTTIDYDGGSLFGEEYISANESLSNWAAVNGCTGQPVETYRNGNARSMTYQSCEGGTQLTLCTIIGGTHVLYGNSSVDIADAAWEFMSWYTLP
jgi:polyhydroxybutyrate depolymerase